VVRCLLSDFLRGNGATRAAERPRFGRGRSVAIFSSEVQFTPFSSRRSVARFCCAVLLRGSVGAGRLRPLLLGEAVLGLIVGLLQLGLGLLMPAFALEVPVARHLAGTFFGCADVVDDGEASLVADSHDAPFP